MARSPRVQLVVDGKNNTKNAFGAVEKSLKNLEQRAQSVGRAMAGALAGVVSIGTLKAIGHINSEWVDMSSRLRRVTADEEEFASVTERLGVVAESTWTGLNETIESYLSMQGPLADMGYTTEEQVNFVSALNNALVVSGAKGERAASVQDALNKAMALGVLRGNNLNTVIEKGGYVAELLAHQMGTTVSGLSALGAQGKITAVELYNALGGNFEMIAEKAEAMPATFEDAMGRVNESIEGAFRDEELMQPLTDSLLELAEVIKDPATREGLAALASALISIGSGAVAAASEFGRLGKELGYFAAHVSGGVSELDQLEAKLEDINRSLSNEGASRTLGSFWYSKEELQAQKADIEEKIKMVNEAGDAIIRLEKEIARLQQRAIVSEASGYHDSRIRQLIAQKEAEKKILVEQYEARKASAKVTVEVDKEAQESALAAKRKHVVDMKTERDKLVADAKKAGKNLEKTEAESLKKIEKLRKDRLGIEEKYRKAIAKITGASVGGEASYAGAEDLKVKAKSALSKGDLKEAKEYAGAALEILKEIAEAGGNTYGFAGFAKELETIELAANSMEIKAEEEKRKKIISDLQEIKLLASEVENINIKLDLDEASLAEVRSKLDQLAKGVVINPSVGEGRAVATSSSTTMTGKKGDATRVKVDADIEPAKKAVDQWHIGVSSQSLVVPVDVDTGKIREDIYRAGNSFSDQPLIVPVDADAARLKQGIYRAGSSFSDNPVTVPADIDAERLKQGIYRVGDSFSDQPPIEVPVEANIEPIGDDVEVGVRAELDQSSVEESVAALQSALDKRKGVVKVQASFFAVDAGADTPGFASGGHIKGPGTGTSDSILARLSNGEYVLRAAAVKQYGTRLLDDMNGLRLPKFASGGLVDQVSSISSAPQNIGTLNFNLPGGESFSVDVAGTSSMDDLHRAALKFGRTRR